MLNSDIAAFREDLLARDKASIIEIAVENYSLRFDMKARLRVMEQISRDMSLQYDEMRNLLKCRDKSRIKNYVWVHRTSELSGTVQVII